MRHVIGLKCTICGEIYQPDEVEYVCPHHGDDGNLDVLYDYAHVEKQWGLGLNQQAQGIWRYKAMLPIATEAAHPPLLVGDTPLYAVDHVAKRLGIRKLWVKDDGRNPTASLKDRASALLVAKAHHEGRATITTASTGNAAAALAGLAASMQMPSVIFVPASAPQAKITQLLVYGAKVLLVNGTYDDAFDLCLEASREFGWYCRNTGYNPYTAEGKKTVSFEICEQIAGASGTFAAPDVIAVSVGDGNIISGVHKGLKDLLALGWIDRMPRLLGVQAEGSSALYQAWVSGTPAENMQPVTAQTIADSISAGLPRDRVKALLAISETGGAYLTVSDEEIIHAIPALARDTGVFAEPAAAATYAGLLKAGKRGLVGAEDRVVALITGNGLKDILTAQKSVAMAQVIEPDIDEVRRVREEIGL